MPLRRFWLGLWLAASPLAAQLPNLTTYRPGALHLELASGLSSQLGFDLQHLNAVICGASDGEQSRGGTGKALSGSLPPGETCRLVIANDGGPNGRSSENASTALGASAEGLFASLCGPSQVTIQPTGLRLESAEPLELDCGPWRVEAELAPSPATPPSVLTLLPAPLGSATGLFTGALALRLDVTYVYAGAEIDLPPGPFGETRELVLDVAGRWTVAQGSPGTGFGETNLALFVDKDTVADSVWLKKGSCAPARRGCSRLCLEASDAVVAALNGLAVN